MAKKSSFKGKKQYPTYKAENRVYKNKIAKLERHIKAYPEDEQAKTALARIQKDGYTGRQRPHVAGSNPTTPGPHLIPGALNCLKAKTAGEQLSELLGISMPKPLKKRKPRVKVKRRKNVQSEKVS